jgi:hypothetical protein
MQARSEHQETEIKINERKKSRAQGVRRERRNSRKRRTNQRGSEGLRESGGEWEGKYWGLASQVQPLGEVKVLCTPQGIPDFAGIKNFLEHPGANHGGLTGGVPPTSCFTFNGEIKEVLSTTRPSLRAAGGGSGHPIQGSSQPFSPLREK